MITVMNKRQTCAQRPPCPVTYVGRPTPLGNPFTHLEGPTLAKFKCATREEAVEHYDAYLTELLQTNLAAKSMFDDLVYQASQGDLWIICWCAPKACHGDVLKRRIEEVLDSLGPVAE